MRSWPRPRWVTVAFWLWVGAAAVAVATALVAVARLDGMHADFVREARANDPSATEDVVNRVAGLSTLIVIGGGLLVAVGAILFAAVMRAGRGWGRGALTVVAATALVYAVLVVSTGLLVVGCAVLAVVATVCMYLPGNRSWFV